MSSFFSPSIPATPPAAVTAVAAFFPDQEALRVAARYGLAGMALLPIPETNTADTIRSLLSNSFNTSFGCSTAPGQTLVFYGARLSHIEPTMQGDDCDVIPGRFTFFGDNVGLLMVKPLFHYTEMAKHHFHNKLLALMPNRLQRELVRGGTETYRAVASTALKIGDCGLRPVSRRGVKDQYPSIAFEAGLSDALPLLRMNRDWWFQHTYPQHRRGGVIVVLTLTFYQNTKKLIVELWRRGTNDPETSISIYPNPLFSTAGEQHFDHWIVARGPLRIGFEDIFLRPPRVGSDEGDFYLSDDFFVGLARLFCQ